MPTQNISIAQINELRKQAKALRQEDSLSSTRALNRVAIENGYSAWNDIARIERQIRRAHSTTSVQYVSEDTRDEVEGVVETEPKYLDEKSKALISSNRAILAREGIDYSVLELTATGLRKSILDATQPVRAHFASLGFHDYESQGKGGDHKVIKSARIVTSGGVVDTQASLYRPMTKNGDPRIWISQLPKFAEAGDQIALVIRDDLVVLHLSKSDFQRSLDVSDGIGRFLSDAGKGISPKAEELLTKLREIARYPLKATTVGDTAVGMSVEAALGIPPNCSKEPDYFGIEIKSGRDKKVRSNLFGQVADWSVSPLKSSAAILDAYGYDREEKGFRLNCTVSTQRANSQGLRFEFDEKADQLVEVDGGGAPVAIWPTKLLRSRLVEKHTETFWIRADSEILEGREHFFLKSVIHTRQPLVNQLLPLIQTGVITMDHLITRGLDGKVKEKGPLFKIDKHNLGLLFPGPVEYSLT